MDITSYKIRPTKHFIFGWMKKWDYDIYSLRNALENAYKIDKVGKMKYEAYFRTAGKSRKLIFVRDDIAKDIIIITGAEGK